jgi:hypothetical protein
VPGKRHVATPRSRLRRGAVVLLVLSFVGPGVPTASAQCGQTVEVAAQHSVLPGAPPLAVGDSVLYDAAQRLAGYGFHSNAMVCRTMAQGIAYLQPRAASLPELVVVALGTNGTVTDAQIDSLLRVIGPSRGLALVTPKGGDDPSAAGLYRAAARRHPGRIIVLDWERVSAGHPDWFAPDGIHLGGAAGIAAFARLVASSLRALPGSVPGPSAPVPSPVPSPTPAPTPTTAPTTVPTPTTATTTPTATQPVNPHPAVPTPASPRPPSLTAGERNALRRVFLNVRLLVTTVLIQEVSVLGD